MLKIAIIAGASRPGEKSSSVAKWVAEQAKKRGDAEYTVISLADLNLPLYDEPVPASMGQYAHAHTKKWAETIAPFDGFVFVTPEYNHSIPAVLKNALDFIYKEWNNKAAGIVGYGVWGAARAVDQLRAILGELQIADVRQATHINLITEFENWSTFKPNANLEGSLKTTLDQLVSWATALKTTRK